MDKSGYTGWAGGLLSIGLVLAGMPAQAAPPQDDEKTADSDTPQVQRPKASGTQPTAQPDQPPEAEGTQPKETEATPDQPSPEPTEPAGETPTPAKSKQPGQPEPQPKTSDPKRSDMGNLLAPSEGADPAGSRPTSPPREESGVGREEKLTRYYSRLYRPADNPGRFNFGARGLFMAAGANHNEFGGRMGGITAEAGQSWNWIGYAITGTAYFGQTIVGKEQEHELNTMVGGGPTLGLGRLSLIRYGYLDFRIGYDFFYSPLKVSALGASHGVTEQPDALAPHGPRFRIDMGLLLRRGGTQRFRHGVGASFGYQRLIGTLIGEMRGANVLMIGFNYYLG